MKFIYQVIVRYCSDHGRDRGSSEHFFCTEDEAIRFTAKSTGVGMWASWRAVVVGVYTKRKALKPSNKTKGQK